MAKKRNGATFAELLTKPPRSDGDAQRSGKHAVRPGRYNLAGDLFDPGGRRLFLLHEDIRPHRAREWVSGGALVAYEACGCGGWTGCQPDWLTSDGLSRLQSAPAPQFVGGHGAPTWIDVWSSALDRVVVYLHGDVRWGDELP